MAKCIKCGKKGLFLKVDAQGLCSDCSAVVPVNIIPQPVSNASVSEEQKQKLDTAFDDILASSNLLKKNATSSPTVSSEEKERVASVPPVEDKETEKTPSVSGKKLTLKKPTDSTALTEEEMEVCSFVQYCLLERGADIKYIRMNKLKSGFFDVTAWQQILRMKTTKKGKYAILPAEYAKYTDLSTEGCSSSEGGTNNVRIYFANPFDLEFLSDYFMDEYKKAMDSMQYYVSAWEGGKAEVEKAMKERIFISENEMNDHLKYAKERDYTEIVLEKTPKAKITRDDVVVNPVHNRCPLSQIKNRNNFDRGFNAGFPLYEKGEAARKSGDINTAIRFFDDARYHGYSAPALYTAYAKLYRSLKDYANEIDIIEEYLSRDRQYGKDGAMKTRLQKTIELLYKQQNS